MSLGWKTILVAVLAVVLIVLKLAARRRDLERFQAEHRRRRLRVPKAPTHPEEGPPHDRP